jgi:hypothetical protein
VRARLDRGDGAVPDERTGTLDLDEATIEALRDDTQTVEAHGAALGERLFTGDVGQLFTQARAASVSSATGQNGTTGPGDPLRVLLSVQDDALRALHWERLCAPVGDGQWGLLSQDMRATLAMSLASTTQRHYPAIGRADLRALIVVASPSNVKDYSLTPIPDVPATIDSVRAALGEIPSDELEAPTLTGLAQALDDAAAQGRPYTLLHVCAHGKVLTAGPHAGESRLYLADSNGETDAVTPARLLSALGQRASLPRLIFFATCESGSPSAAFGNLAELVVQRLGVLAAVAMTAPVSLDAAQQLGAGFYRHLRRHGQPDLALAAAMAALASGAYRTVPALFTRLRGQPLFTDRADLPLTDPQIEVGLRRLSAFVDQHAPVLREIMAQHTLALRRMRGVPTAELDVDARRERVAALAGLDDVAQEYMRLAAPSAGWSPTSPSMRSSSKDATRW